MEIHDLNTKSLTDPAYVAFDDGTDTYKVEFNDTVESAAQAAVAEADLTQNTVGFTSGDSLSPTGWTDVSQITTNSTLATLFNRISTMVKNVRYIWNLLGSSSFSNVASTLSGAIGNTALTTTAQTLSGAIAEHESDISTLNSKFSIKTKTYTYAGVTFNFYKTDRICIVIANSACNIDIPTNAYADTDTVIDSTVRPLSSVIMRMMQDSTGNSVSVNITSVGSLRMGYAGTKIESGTAIRINLCYITAS